MTGRQRPRLPPDCPAPVTYYLAGSVHRIPPTLCDMKRELDGPPAKSSRSLTRYPRYPCDKVKISDFRALGKRAKNIGSWRDPRRVARSRPLLGRCPLFGRCPRA